MTKFIGVVLVTALTVYVSTQARSAQDTGKLLFENHQLCAVEYVIKAGGKLSSAVVTRLIALTAVATPYRFIAIVGRGRFILWHA